MQFGIKKKPEMLWTMRRRDLGVSCSWYLDYPGRAAAGRLGGGQREAVTFFTEQNGWADKE